MTQSKIFAEVKACLHLAIPLAGAQLAQASTSFVDVVMMGWLGSQYIAAGGLGGSAFAAMLYSSAAVMSAVSPLVAQAWGGGQFSKIGHTVQQGLWLAAAIALPVTLLLWNSGTFLKFLGQEPATVALTEEYLRAIALGFFPGLAFAVLRSFVAAMARPRPIVVIIICGTLVNVGLNYVLMFGRLGFPALGLTGIGCASSVSLWFNFFALSAYILSQPQLRQYQVFSNLRRVHGSVMRELVRVGVPIGLLTAMETGLFTVTTFLMGTLGSTTLAAHQIALQTASLTFMVPMGVAMATTVRVGQLIGQENPSGAKLAGYVGISLGAGCMAVMGMVMWLMPQTIVSLYLDVHDPANDAVVTLAASLLGIAALFQLADGVQVCAVGALRGLKDTFIPMVIGIVAYWGIGLTSGYLLGIRLGYGGVGLWAGLAIALAAAAAILTWRFSRFGKTY